MTTTPRADVISRVLDLDTHWNASAIGAMRPTSDELDEAVALLGFSIGLARRRQVEILALRRALSASRELR